MGKASRDKGIRFELKMTQWLRLLFPRARRSANQAGGAVQPDVDGTPFWVECKHDNGVSIWTLMKQARRDRDLAGSKRPVVGILKKDRKPAIVAMDPEDWIQLVTYAMIGRLFEVKDK